MGFAWLRAFETICFKSRQSLPYFTIYPVITAEKDPSVSSSGRCKGPSSVWANRPSMRQYSNSLHSFLVNLLRNLIFFFLLLFLFCNLVLDEISQRTNVREVLGPREWPQTQGKFHLLKQFSVDLRHTEKIISLPHLQTPT